MSPRVIFNINDITRFSHNMLINADLVSQAAADISPHTGYTAADVI